MGGGGGDWNCILDKSLDSMGGNIKLKKNTIKEIEKLNSDFDLLDIGREKNPSFRKGPVKLIKRVKIAHSFLQSVSNQFHVITLSLPM